MTQKNSEDVIRAGVVGAAIGAIGAAAAVAWSDKEKRDKATTIARDLTQKAQHAASDFRGALGGASARVKEVSEKADDKTQEVVTRVRRVAKKADK